ncbi:MAG: hypothetical protein ABGZ35_10840 [Planctomycetaceae bacterium]
MEYRVRLQYAVHVEARDGNEAFTKACKAISEQPGSHIARIERAEQTTGKRSIVKRIITGK